jgi:glycosyltransferase involved in cell wall biosynthesis
VLEQARVQSPDLPELEISDGFVKGRVSIVMPAFNEADGIRRSIVEVSDQFSAVCSDYEIIVVDDGSTDGTRKAAEIMVDPRVKVIGYGANQGKGHALRLGLHRATGEFTFMVDSDSEIRPRELAGYLRSLESADIVIGSKRHPLSNVQTPVVRRFLSIGFNTLERILTGVRVTDTQAGLKAAKSRALYQILPLLSVKKYAFDAELLAVASLLNMRIQELPVFIELRATFSVRKVFRMLIDLLGITFRLRIRRWYQKNMVTMSRTYSPIISW